MGTWLVIRESSYVAFALEVRFSGKWDANQSNGHPC